MLIMLGVAFAADCLDQVEDAEARLRARKPLAATLGAHELLESGACPTYEGRAHLVLGRGLLDLELPHSAQHHFLEVLRDPPSERSAELAVIRLVHIADLLGDDTELSRLATVLPEQDWPEPVRDRLHYVAGVRAWQRGDVSVARRHFGLVDPQSAVGSQAHYSEAVALLEQGRVRGAAQELVLVGRLGEHADWAALGLGRVYYGVGRYDEAQRWFEEVPVDSELFAEARFENAWARFMDQDPNGALGELLTLDSPGLGAWQPEAHLLEAITWYSLCDWGAARTSLDRLDAQVVPVHEELHAYVRSFAGEQGRRQADRAWRDWFVDERETALTKAVFLRLLDDRPLQGAVSHLEQLDAEVALIGRQKRLWRDALGSSLLQRLAGDRQGVERRAGLHLLRRMAELDLALRDLLSQRDLVHYELLRAEREGLEELAGGARPPQVEGEVPYAVDPSRIMWPFNGEFWEDELGSYRYTESGRCW